MGELDHSRPSLRVCAHLLGENVIGDHLEGENVTGSHPMVETGTSRADLVVFTHGVGHPGPA